MKKVLFALGMISIIQFAFSKSKDIGIEDTMVTDEYTGVISKSPTLDLKNEIKIKKNSIVIVLSKTPIVETEFDRSWIKIKTLDNKIGYISENALLTKNQYNSHIDSIKTWRSLPLPTYKNLVGTTYSKKESLPKELASGQFITLGKGQDYSLASVGNIYNKNYEYIFFEKMNNTGTDKISNTILDIVALDLTKFTKNATVWFQQCECKSKKDCSDIVAIYFHNDSMATKNIMVKPDKAWRPNYATKKLEAIPPESVKCGSMAPEEDDANGP
jgi:hypothetical protein